MRKVCRLLFILTFSLSVVSWTACSSGKRTQRTTNNISGNTTYRISITEENPQIARLEVSLILQDSVLYMSRIGANQLPDRWAGFVHGLKAQDTEGNVIAVKKKHNASWGIAAKEGEPIQLSYEVHLDHEKHEWSGGIDGAAYTTDWGVFYTGRALFIMNGQTDENINIEFDLPPGWKVTTPWTRMDKMGLVYSAKSLQALGEGMLFAGEHEELSFRRDDFELVFALGGEEIIAQKEDFRMMAEGVLDYYIDLMGGIPNPPANNRFNKAVVIMNNGSTTDGEVIGNNISIILEENPDQMAQMVSRFIFAHEFFHLWNGKSFTPANEEAEWFKEGFSNYYTLKALHQVGFLDDQSFLDVLNGFFFQRYINDEGLGTVSMSLGEEKHDHWGLIYAGGMFVGICQDMIIRKASGNEKSLDDLMRSFFQQYGGTEEYYTVEDLKEKLSALSGQDQTPFFEAYILGVQRVPIAEHLRLSGLEANIEDRNLVVKKSAQNLSPLQESMIRSFLGE